MSKYLRDDFTEFDSYDDAWEDAMEQMDFTDFAERFECQVNFWDLLNWARKQPNFYDDFCDAVSDAEQDYFDDFYRELEDDEDENCECESESNL